MRELERKYGKYAVKNLPLLLIICYAIGYTTSFLAPGLLSWLSLDPRAILHGQVWRIVTWVLIPPGSSNIFWILISLYFYYSLGTTLERTWGTFRFNVYIFSGFLFTILGSFLLIPLTRLIVPEIATMPASYAEAAFRSMSFSFSTYYVNMSIFLAFAATFPDVQVLLMLFIPVKVKWLGIIYAVILMLDLFQGPYYQKVAIAASLLNFVIFWLQSRGWQLDPKQAARRAAFRKATGGSAHMRGGMRSGQASGGPVLPRCAVCGRTPQDDPNLEFRYCSKCNGSYEYCQDHLFTHVHKT